MMALPWNVAEAQTFKNCAAVKAKYPNGVAINFGAIGTSGAEVNRADYLRNQRLDRDNDGLICENEWAQSIGGTTTSTASTTTSTASTTTSTASTTTSTASTTTTSTIGTIPAGDWANLNFRSTDRLLFGRGYRLFICASGSGATSLSVQIGSEWIVKAVSVVRQEPALCSDPAFPYAHSYFWNVDVKGPNAETAVLTRLNNFTITMENIRVIVLSETALTTTTTTTTTTIAPSIGGSGGISRSRSWLGCYLNGKKMWGRVYVSQYSWAADFKVYVSPFSWSADLKVYNTPYSWGATSCGLWYLTPYSWDADFTVYFTTYSWDANLSIYVTPYSWAAGR
jgi:hypothetical protein